MGTVAMGVLSIREFNQNVSEAFARVEDGESLIITKNGKVFAEVRPKTDAIDPARQQAIDDMMAGMRRGIDMGGTPATYEERTE
jgi:antitoxin (DNA-binding transcriptional repressor) of toxin-antitoxin stability system